MWQCIVERHQAWRDPASGIVYLVDGLRVCDALAQQRADAVSVSAPPARPSGETLVGLGPYRRAAPMPPPPPATSLPVEGRRQDVADAVVTLWFGARHRRIYASTLCERWERVLDDDATETVVRMVG